MKFKISKHVLYQLLFAACIMVSYLDNYEVTFLVWAITAMLTVKFKFSAALLKYSSFFIGIIIVAAVSGFLYRHSVYNIIRDITYLLKPIVGLFAGYQLCRYNGAKTLNVVVYTGLAIAIIHLFIAMLVILRTGSFSVNNIRSSAGFFSDFEIYVLIILIFHKEFNLIISRQRLRLLLLVIGLSSFLYLARTNLIQIVILYLGMKGFLTLNKRSIAILSTFILVALVGYSAVYYSNPKRNGKGIEAFLYKIKIAPIEPFKTKIDKDDWKDFNDNYRSYENIIAVRQVSQNGTGAVLFGEGLGSTLDLGREVHSNDGGFVRYIPIVHNGFMTVFLKSGLAGVLLLLAFIYTMIRQGKTDNDQVRNINYLLTATGFFLIISNWVFLGLYLKLDNKSVLIGFLLCYRYMIKRNESPKYQIQNAAN